MCHFRDPAPWVAAASLLREFDDRFSNLPGQRDVDAADRSCIGLARQIHAMVAAGAFEAGARLPSERSLADRFGVSRTQVREAIIALEVQGIVEVRVGSGIYVSAADAAKPVTFEVPRGPGPIETLRIFIRLPCARRRRKITSGSRSSRRRGARHRLRAHGTDDRLPSPRLNFERELPITPSGSDRHSFADATG